MVCTYKFRSTIFSGDRITSYNCSSPGTSQQIRDNTDPACVISVDCARGFALLHWLNVRYVLHCFVFLRLHCGLSSTA